MSKFDKPFIIFGCNGGFGTIFTNKLLSEGVRIIGIDLHNNASNSEAPIQYLSNPSLDDNAELQRAYSEARGIILATPEDVSIEILPHVLKHAHPESVVMDLTSVKTNIAKTVSDLNPQCGYVSIHPLFPPVPDFSGRTVAYIELANNASADLFLSLLDSWGATVVKMSAEAHDKATSVTQSLPHAALLAFGLTVLKSGVSFETIWTMSTPIQRTMLGLLRRVAGRDELVHFDLQNTNPYADAIRTELSSSLKLVSQASKEEKPDDFILIASEINAMLNAVQHQIDQVAANIVNLTPRNQKSRPSDSLDDLEIE
ncbi:prephenate dehydrogenase/arogenate dehydrogenase family protein [Pseudorhodoferax sp.]|uniref:prephenate dehydrogenase/arogenate dehydrogenase family protein n=1 Tax=Pseudorhodoferax sp. TaxID=1993553 RepID=UPI002DD6A696|nr:prephenate dehydrogenase/arogenate dehydrogenase family protein [Pseudorhodoferax sp.]